MKTIKIKSKKKYKNVIFHEGVLTIHGKEHNFTICEDKNHNLELVVLENMPINKEIEDKIRYLYLKQTLIKNI